MLPKTKTERHSDICKEINALYAMKNHDYGDSFHQTFTEEGMAMPRIRLGDKMARFKPPCHNGDPCHVAAPRGARTGTQGLKNHVERSRIPDGLCNYIVQICEDGMNYKKFFEKAGD